MPELPEVQTIIDDLNRKIKGDTIVGFWSDWGKSIKNETISHFSKVIKNRKILGARRIGKNIFIDLSGGKTLYLHLKMTGHLLVKRETCLSDRQTQNAKSKNKEKNYFLEKVNQYVHHIFYLKTRNAKPAYLTGRRKTQDKKYDKTMEFSDLRKFGKIVLDDTEEIKNLKEIKALGIDAMSSEFTFQKFNQILDKKVKSPIGLVLMDQNQIAGVGNIYRSEILFDAGVLPKRKVSALSKDERKKVYKAIGKILKIAIKYRGTSDSDYRDTSGAPGGFQNVVMVYRREKQKCQKCDTIIKREALGQRSLFVCPKCQK